MDECLANELVRRTADFVVTSAVAIMEEWYLTSHSPWVLRVSGSGERLGLGERGLNYSDVGDGAGEVGSSAGAVGAKSRRFIRSDKRKGD